MDVSPAQVAPDSDMHPAGGADRIRYLALEGGGGKGGAYLGAVIALEELGLLPIDPDKTKNQLEGIAGASAGSITAFLLALGQDSQQMWQGIVKGVYKAFLDSPKCGFARRAVFAGDAAPGGQISDSERSNKGGLVKILAGIALRYVLSALLILPARKLTKKTRAEYDNKMLAALTRHLPGYLRNLFGDPGLFPAFAVRKFLTDQLAERLAKGTPQSPQAFVERAGAYTFAEFLDLTGVDLVVAGTNLSTGTPHFFSAKTTPAFPVVEAVGLSMSIPIMFKSVWIDTESPRYAKYRGWWADGGICLNLPLHAFNRDRSGQVPEEARTRAKQPLNPLMLGLTLNDGDLSQFGDPPPAPKEYPNPIGMIGLLMEAMLYGSTEGQIRDPEERRQVVWLQAYFLETYDLSVDPVLVAATVLESRWRVHRSLEGAQPRSTPAILDSVIAALRSNWKKLHQLTPDKYVAKVKNDINKLYYE